MLGVLAALLVVVPFVELFVIIQVADGIGILPTILLLLFVSFAGAWLLKQQGTATWRRMRETMRRGEMPADEATDGALILFGGALLLTPGFVTDVIGLSFLVPTTRRAVRVGARRVVAGVVRRRLDRSGARPVVYEAGVTKVRRRDGDPSATPGPRPTFPSAGRRDGEDDSPGRG